MVDDAVVKTVQRFLAAVHSSGIPVEFGVLLGSWARGTASPESDIDVMVVSPRFDALRAHRDVATLWRLAARIDSRIEPLPCGSRQWREDEASPILAVVREEGKAIAPAESLPRALEVETAWRQEVAARVAALEAGGVTMTPWEDIRDRFLGRLRAPIHL